MKGAEVFWFMVSSGAVGIAIGALLGGHSDTAIVCALLAIYFRLVSIHSGYTEQRKGK